MGGGVRAPADKGLCVLCGLVRARTRASVGEAFSLKLPDSWCEFVDLFDELVKNRQAGRNSWATPSAVGVDLFRPPELISEVGRLLLFCRSHPIPFHSVPFHWIGQAPRRLIRSIDVFVEYGRVKRPHPSTQPSIHPFNHGGRRDTKTDNKPRQRVRERERPIERHAGKKNVSQRDTESSWAVQNRGGNSVR